MDIRFDIIINPVKTLSDKQTLSHKMLIFAI